MSEKKIHTPYYSPTQQHEQYQLPILSRIAITAILGAMIGLIAFYLLQKLGF